MKDAMDISSIGQNYNYSSLDFFVESGVTLPMTSQILKQPNAGQIQKIHEQYISQDTCTAHEVLGLH